ncbi:MAG TPA: ATP-binding cassette domain-containing protein [Candidatus Dormibacteraeota bacterium]|nr:ATP-binding cassette domain-containing protein [Candidatus Dormibacteraeota bacterium]
MSRPVTPTIKVRDLRKVFTVTRREPGLRGALRSLVAPARVEVAALAGISFDMEPTERLALIGPNGAGKSTAIKILTGILQPTSGNCEVLGLVPWKQREQLARHVGTVFGQRPQLWYHLPAVDTLRLLAAVYDIDGRTAERRIRELADVFDLGSLLEVPVRKLSLGQRMRCEVAASLIHRPRLLLLDEPSIGLDPVAKHHIREMVLRMSEQDHVGVLVTSHDAGDIEALCRRVIIVEHGLVVYHDELQTLRSAYLSSKRVRAHFAGPATLGGLPPGVRLLRQDGISALLHVDTRRATIDGVLGLLSRAGELADLVISEPSLEEVIRAVFSGGRLEATS